MIRAAIYSDNEWNDEIVGFSVIKVKHTESSRVISAPVETGVMSFDNKVIDPRQVVVTGVIHRGDYDAADKISSMLANRDFEFYSVSDGHQSYNNLILQTSPALRDVDKFDLIQYDLVFVEAILISKQSSKPANPENTDTRNLGNQNGTEA